uniref:hypothetical protein n=1 Tax=Caballeronia sp. INML5 TaxID=2921750 RepID=UPI002027B4E1
FLGTKAMSKFSINKFEYLCYRRERELAYRELLKLLAIADQNWRAQERSSRFIDWEHSEFHRRLARRAFDPRYPLRQP